MGTQWRELTYINDYEFDPDGNYDGSLSDSDWNQIFTELLQRAETTEEYLNNDWIAPVSTRNAYTYYTKRAGVNYVVLKYYDGMYALYEISNSDVSEQSEKIKNVIIKIDSGVSIRQAIMEANNKTKNQIKARMFEDVAGMDKDSHDILLAQMNKWTGGSSNNGWQYKTNVTNNNNTFVIRILKNPINNFESPVDLDIAGNVLNGEVYHSGTDEYLAASGPITFAGLKSILRDLLSQVEMADAEVADEANETGDIYGY